MALCLGARADGRCLLIGFVSRSFVFVSPIGRTPPGSAPHLGERSNKHSAQLRPLAVVDSDDDICASPSFVPTQRKRSVRGCTLEPAPSLRDRHTALGRRRRGDVCSSPDFLPQPRAPAAFPSRRSAHPGAAPRSPRDASHEVAAGAVRVVPLRDTRDGARRGPGLKISGVSSDSRLFLRDSCPRRRATPGLGLAPGGKESRDHGASGREPNRTSGGCQAVGSRWPTTSDRFRASRWAAYGGRRSLVD